MELFFELLLAALAVFGLWCALRLLAETWFSSRFVMMAVEVSDEDAKASLWQLLEETRANLSCRRGSHIVVLYDRSLLQDGALPSAVRGACRRFGARCYIIDGALAGKENIKS